MTPSDHPDSLVSSRDALRSAARTRLSAHNSAQDDFDEERWADLRVRVESLVKEYDDIGAWVYE